MTYLVCGIDISCLVSN